MRRASGAALAVAALALALGAIDSTATEGVASSPEATGKEDPAAMTTDAFLRQAETLLGPGELKDCNRTLANMLRSADRVVRLEQRRLMNLERACQVQADSHTCTHTHAHTRTLTRSHTHEHLHTYTHTRTHTL